MENRWIIRQSEEVDRVEQIDTVALEYDIMRAQNMHYGLNYVILDAAQWSFDIEDACSRNPEYRLLFATNGIDKNLETVSPYLFAYEQGNDFAKWLDKNRDDSKGVLYIYSKLTIEELRRHLRRFLRVKNESGKWFLFRYYDPIVAQSIFPYLTDEQKAIFFSKIEYIAYHDVYDNALMTATEDVEARKYAITNDIPIGSAFKLLNSQIIQISKAIFENKVISDIKHQTKLANNKKDLSYFVHKYTEKALEYGLIEERYIYEFILLTIKYPILQGSLPNEFTSILKSGRTDYDKIIDLEVLLRLKIFSHVKL